eukprot:gene14804-17495_t
MSLPMFWGMEVPSGKGVKYNCAEGAIINVNQVCLGDKPKADERVTVFIQVGDNPKVAIGTLVKVYVSHTGSGPIYLVGQEGDAGDDSDDDDDPLGDQDLKAALNLGDDEDEDEDEDGEEEDEEEDEEGDEGEDDEEDGEEESDDEDDDGPGLEDDDDDEENPALEGEDDDDEDGEDDEDD